MRFGSQLFCLVAVRLWANFLTSLGLAFLIWKAGLVMAPASRSCCEGE